MTKTRSIPTLTPFVQQVLDRYEARAPIAFAVRLSLEHTFAAPEIDAIFEVTRQAQYDKTLHFSTVVDVMVAVVTRVVPSVNAGILALGEALPVTRTAFYNKLNATETPIAAAFVAHSARKARALIEATGGKRTPVLPGYRLKIVDGAHLAHTERRSSVLWGCAAGPLPGLCLSILEPDVMLVTAAIPCEDGHAQERSLTADLLAHVEAGDCLMGDRNFCTTPILFGVAARHAVSVIREHAHLPWSPAGARIAQGRIPKGEVFEQAIVVEGADGAKLPARRITLVLDTPTRDGDSELHLITTIPAERASATAVAQAYAARWRIETAFGHMASWLESEIDTLGYQRAALLGFCVGVMAYNTLSVVQGAARGARRDGRAGAGLGLSPRSSGPRRRGRPRYAAGGQGLGAVSPHARGRARSPPRRDRPAHPISNDQEGEAWAEEARPEAHALQEQPSRLDQEATRPRQLMTRRGRAHPTDVDRDGWTSPNRSFLSVGWWGCLRT